jgi:hypothetical protein
MNNTEHVPEKQNLLILESDASLKMALRMEIFVGLLSLSWLTGTPQKLHGYFPKAPSLFALKKS